MHGAFVDESPQLNEIELARFLEVSIHVMTSHFLKVTIQFFQTTIKHDH